ncbi:MAG: hypothetical protein HW391_760 [Chloroflexi bacterium]|nr:hypothetical protein [Chloroflexota bacterium]
MPGSDAIAWFWEEYAAASGASGSYTAWGFGDESLPELMTELGLLVRDGPKRATTSTEAAFASGEEPMPQVGDHSVILDGEGRPLCIIRTASVEVRQFGEVDEAFAWVEGEGDRSLAHWRTVHEWFFAREGTPMDDATRVVLERFVKVWPPPVDAEG